MLKNLILPLAFLFTTGGTAAAQSKDEKDLAARVEALRQAMVSGQKADLEKIVSEDLSYGHSSGKIEDKAAFVHALTSGESDFTEITLSDQTIRISGNTALVRHKLTGQTNDKGKSPGTVNLGVLLVWSRQKGEWKLLARQAFKL